MKKVFLFAIVFSLVSCNPAAVDYTQFVNPFIGTDYVGNTYPGAQVPFGMVQLSPDNGLPGWDRIAGYFYPDSTISGFSHTHLQGTGAGDLYDISFLPVTLPYQKAEAPLGIHSKFSHTDEHAEAGYYQVLLTDYNIRVELTATERVGIQRYRFPEAESAVLLDLAKAMNWDFTRDSEIRLLDSVTIGGYRFSEGWAADQRIYFVTKFSRPFDSFSIDTTTVLDRETALRCGKGAIARFEFKTTEGETVVLKTALSGVSVEGALRNLLSEAPHNDFETYRKNAKERWSKELSKIQVEGGTPDDKVNFYTALYHSFTAPTLFCDVDGAYRGADKQIHAATDWENYSTFSLWDTYRASHPLFTILQPQRTSDMIRSFLAHYNQFGRLPVWNFYGNETDMMIGYHSVPVIVDAYLKGIGNFDPEEALQACIVTANVDHYRAIGLYKQLGYVPCDKETESLSKTLEYAFDDWCIAQMAQKMGKTEIARTFFERAAFYRNLYNPATGFLQPRQSDGTFFMPFDPKEYTAHITESNAWHYLWSVQHDTKGLVSLMGGEKLFSEKLDTMFAAHATADDELPIFSTGMIGQYAHGNEPSHHVIYLYNAVRQPWKTQQLAAQVMNELYLNTPAGLCGNEDCGQLSAWFVFSAMGFYPVNPAGLRYEIGTPLFEKVQVRLENGKIFTVKAKNLSKQNIYIQRVKVNGADYRQSYLTHEQLLSGTTVEFEMGDKKNSCWY